MGGGNSLRAHEFLLIQELEEKGVLPGWERRHDSYLGCGVAWNSVSSSQPLQLLADYAESSVLRGLLYFYAEAPSTLRTMGAVFSSSSVLPYAQ